MRDAWCIENMNETILVVEIEVRAGNRKPRFGWFSVRCWNVKRVNAFLRVRTGNFLSCLVDPGTRSTTSSRWS
jgi:hypothetical protein